MSLWKIIRIIKEIRGALRIVGLKVQCLDICKKAGLKERDIKILMATVSAESGWNSKAININSNGSRDLGVIQANDYWYIKKMKLLTEWEALHDTKKCFEVMAQRWLLGKADDWYGHRDGAYKRFL